jgi:hypothetical protein
LSAVAAVELLASFALPTVALSGLFTNSPLAREEVQISSNVSAVRTSDLGTWFARRATRVAAKNAAEPVSANPMIG